MVAVILVVAGVWTSDAVKEAVSDELQQDLNAVVASQATGLRLWLTDRSQRLTAIADEEDLSRWILSDPTDPPPPALVEELVESLDDFLPEHIGWAIVAPSGRFLHVDPPNPALTQLSEHGMALLAGVLRGQPLLRRPRRTQAVIEGGPGMSPDAPAVLTLASPVAAGGGPIVGVMVAWIDPEKEFTGIMRAAQREEGGVSFAFDADGVLLSDYRYEDELRELGLLVRDTSARSLNNLQLRDPGGDLTRGYKPAEAWDLWPPTEMVRQAVAGHDGVNVRGYRDVRGVPVVGAWRWLGDWEIGVGVEIDRRRALRARRPVRLAFTGLIVLLGCTGAVIFITALRIDRLQRRITEVQELGQYRLIRKLGEGGMGAVYLAQPGMLRRRCVIKMIRPDVLDEDALARFEREVQHTSELRHPNTIQIYDYGRTDAGIFYYVMEYVDGPTVEQIVRAEGAMPPGRVAHLIEQACGSLAEAHEAGFVHRDIKPSNIMVAQLGGLLDVAKVIDFGLVKEMAAQPARDVTSPQAVIGTPVYLAPEALRGQAGSGPAVDVYALGAVMFFMLSGRMLLEGGSAQQLAERTVHGETPRLREAAPDVPAELDALVAECLEKDPSRRPASMKVIAERLRAIGAASPWSAADAEAWWAAWKVQEKAPEEAEPSAQTVRVAHRAGSRFAR